MNDPFLRAAFEDLMERAPSALFKRARRLYLDKYCLDGRDYSGPLRLFVAKEKVDEWVEPDPKATPNGKVAVMTIRPTLLALVHWQQQEAASNKMCMEYLHDKWGLDHNNFMDATAPWFRNGGHQQQGKAPETLIWTRRTFYSEGKNDPVLND